MDKPCLGRADAVAELAIALGGSRLPAELSSALFLLPEDLAEPREIGFRRAQLLLSILATAWRPEIPAASSSSRRRSVGLAAMIDPTLPWLTKAGECAPVAASAKSSDTSLARTSRPSIR
jgi:hypothetical protein